jgi:GT2 family glycosyltransferase
VTLHPIAIYLIKKQILKAKSRPAVIYTDHDFKEELKLAAVFKPQPSLAYLYCFDYIRPAVVYRADVLAGQSDDLQLKCFEPEFLYSRALSAFEHSIQDVHHISEALFQLDEDIEIQTPFLGDQTVFESIKLKPAAGYNQLLASEDLQIQDRVDVVIPTRDGLSVLKPCIESILTKTEGVDFTVFIVDNGSEKQETLDYFESFRSDDRVKVLSYPGEFNYSAINNFAVRQGNAPYIALVNNDIEVIESDWLLQMMAWAKQPKVGIVGAKLLYSNGDIQHAGVTIGMGNAAGHIHRKEAGDSDGYQYRCRATQNMMAVTAACLLTKRAIFTEIGGLNETDFAVAYNDIDYCLKVEQRGYDIIWTAEALLYHHESISRGDDMSDKHIKRYFRELSRFQKRWKAKGFVDKYYNKHLRISDEGVYPQIPGSGKANLKFLD